MNVAQLSGAALDCWVARAEGMRMDVSGDEPYWVTDYCAVIPVSKYKPSDEWDETGLILARQRYTLYPLDEIGSKGAGTRRVWIAEAQMNPEFHDMYRDELPLVAICRLRVAEALAAGVIKF